MVTLEAIELQTVTVYLLIATVHPNNLYNVCDSCRQGGATEAPLGRVFVKDPDDWDVDDKIFSWAGPSHPLFTLSPHTGDLLASSQVKEGR